jgi:hypothetical protein
MDMDMAIEHYYIGDPNQLHALQVEAWFLSGLEE